MANELWDVFCKQHSTIPLLIRLLFVFLLLFMLTTDLREVITPFDT